MARTPATTPAKAAVLAAHQDPEVHQVTLAPQATMVLLATQVLLVPLEEARKLLPHLAVHALLDPLEPQALLESKAQLVLMGILVQLVLPDPLGMLDPRAQPVLLVTMVTPAALDPQDRTLREVMAALEPPDPQEMLVLLDQQDPQEPLATMEAQDPLDPRVLPDLQVLPVTTVLLAPQDPMDSLGLLATAVSAQHTVVLMAAFSSKMVSKRRLNAFISSLPASLKPTFLDLLSPL